LPQREVPEAAQEIWTEYLSGDSLNIDSQSRELSRKNMLAPDRWAFDIAAVCNRTFSLCKIKICVQRHDKQKNKSFQFS